MKANTIKDLLARWPNRSAVLQDALVEHPDLELVAVHRWAQRNTIPPKYWSSLIKGASARDIGLTADELVAAHAPVNEASSTSQEDAA